MDVSKIITGIMLLFALLGVLLGGGSSGLTNDTGSSEAEDPLAPVPTTATVIRDASSTVSVNLLQLGDSLEVIRLSHPYFPGPEQGKQVFVESGAQRTMYTYQDAKFFFDGDTLDQIRIKQTPEFVHAGTPLQRAQGLYGEIFKAFETSNGNHYAVIKDSIDPHAVWVFGYSPSTMTISSISLAQESSYTISKNHRRPQ